MSKLIRLEWLLFVAAALLVAAWQILGGHDGSAGVLSGLAFVVTALTAIAWMKPRWTWRSSAIVTAIALVYIDLLPLFPRNEFTKVFLVFTSYTVGVMGGILGLGGLFLYGGEFLIERFSKKPAE